jgi:hypothetical protein
MKSCVAVVMLSLALAACGDPSATAGTGIQGIVQVGPTCPVERVNSPCPPHPIAATIVVRDATGAEVTRFRSGADGRFKCNLVPGTYSLVGLTIGTNPLPRPIATSVTVSQGTYTSVNIDYDSGIR